MYLVDFLQETTPSAVLVKETYFQALYCRKCREAYAFWRRKIVSLCLIYYCRRQNGLQPHILSFRISRKFDY